MKKLGLFIVFGLSVLNANVECADNSCVVDKNMTFWGINLYHFSYLVNDKEEEKIVLTYKRDISKEKNVEKTVEKFAQNNEDAEKWRNLLDEWNSHLTDVREGTVYEVVVNETGATMFIDKKERFHTQSKLFGQKYVRIWSGESSVDEDLRRELLVAKNTIAKNMK